MVPNLAKEKHQYETDNYDYVANNFSCLRHRF